MCRNDRLRCLSNRDYSSPTYRSTITCLIDSLVPTVFGSINCDNIWGTRSVQVEAEGSIEVFKMTRFPEESNFNEYIAVNATRWLELSQSDGKAPTQDMTKFVPAEPVYLCVRANEWSGAAHSTFEIKFHKALIRRGDKLKCRQYILIHAVFILLCASMYLLPYALALSLGINVYYLGMKLYTTILLLSILVLFFCPLMLTNHNRYMARLYFKYFFTRSQAEETKKAIREKMPLFQSLFFSSALVVLGSIFGQLLFRYAGIDRELRNDILRIVMAIATSWLVFFVARSFQRFVRNWIWILMSVILARSLNYYVNPMSRDEIIISILVATYIFKFLLKNTLRVIKRRRIHLNIFDKVVSNFPKSLSFPQLLDWIFLSIQFYRGRKKSQVFHMTNSNGSLSMPNSARSLTSLNISTDLTQERQPVMVKISSNISQLNSSGRRSDLALSALHGVSRAVGLSAVDEECLTQQEYTNSYTNAETCVAAETSCENPPRIEDEEEIEEEDDSEDDDENGVFLEDIFVGSVEVDENTGKLDNSFLRNRSGSNIEDKLDSGGTNTPGSLHSARTATRADRLEEDDFLANLQNSLYNMISSDGDQSDNIALDQLVEDALADDDLSIQESEYKVDSEKTQTRKTTSTTANNASSRDMTKILQIPTNRKASFDRLGGSSSSNLLDKSKEETFFDQDSELIINASIAVVSSDVHTDLMESLRGIERQIRLLMTAQANENTQTELPLILSSMNATTRLNHLLIEMSERCVHKQKVQDNA